MSVVNCFCKKRLSLAALFECRCALSAAVCCVLFDVRCASFGVCRSMCIVIHVLLCVFIVCCLMFGVSCSLFVACCR